MQAIIFLKQLFGMIRKDPGVENSVRTLSDIPLKEHMLFEGNFSKDLKRLYSLDRSSVQPANLENLSDEALWKKLWNLDYLLGAWEDSGLSRENKKERHALKYKKDLAKSIRKPIRKALYSEVINLAKAVKERTEDSELDEQLETLSVDAQAREKITGSQLIELTSKCLHSLKTTNPALKSPEDKDIKKGFKEAASAIISFKTLPQKILASLSVSVAVIAALACGFFTGGFIYVLLGSFGVAAGVAIGLAALAGLFGFTVNVRFFSKSLPEFLLKLINPSRVTEFINDDGKREQLKGFKKHVYLPLAAIFSVAVGIAFAAFSMAQFAAILVALPFLAATGPLPIILAVILAITMTIVMFKAFVEIAPKLSLSKLGQSLKTAWKEMSFMKFLSYAITLVVCGIGIFGLAMACHAGLQTLVNAFGGPTSIFASVFAYVVLATSFVGQLPFNILTVSTFCKVMGNFLLSIPEKIKNLFRQSPAQSSETLEKEKSSFLNKITSAGRYIWESIIIPVLLFVNAIANGAGIMIGKPSTAEYVAGAAGALNSISGNLVSNNNTQERSQSDNEAVQKLKDALNTQKKSQTDEAVIQEPSVSEVDAPQPDSAAKVNPREELVSSLPSSSFASCRPPVSLGRSPSASSLASEDSGLREQEQLRRPLLIGARA